MRRRIPAAILLGVALAAAVPARAVERVSARTMHYEVTSAGDLEEAREWARVLEAAWPQFSDFFGAEPRLKPDDRLHVAVFEGDPAWRAAIAAGGGTPPDAGGYYCPVARTAYLKRQPSAWYTRTLLIHEAAHQFHYLARAGSGSPPASWYVEGIAEHLSSHTWDGETLRLGVVPLLSLEDRAGAARRSLADPGFDLRGIIESDTASRPESMHLTRFLLDGAGGRRASAFHALARKIDRGTQPTWRQFVKRFGAASRLVPEMRDWLDGVQEPWASVFVEWEARGAAHLRGRAGVVSVCRRKGATKRLEATLQPPAEGPWKAGLLVDFAGPDDYTVALVAGGASGGSFRVDRRAGGKWERQAEKALADLSREPVRLAAVRGDGGVAVALDGAPLGTVRVATEVMGLAVDACTADFSEISAE